MIRLIGFILMPIAALYNYCRNLNVFHNRNRDPYFKGCGALKFAKRMAIKRHEEDNRKYYVFKIGHGYIVANRGSIDKMKKMRYLSHRINVFQLHKAATFVAQ